MSSGTQTSSPECHERCSMGLVLQSRMAPSLRKRHIVNFVLILLLFVSPVHCEISQTSSTTAQRSAPKDQHTEDHEEHHEPDSHQDKFDWTHGQNAEKTFLFTNCHWWESMDHQMTTIITLLSIAENTSSIAVIPPLPSSSSKTGSNLSLLGDYFDLDEVRKAQPAVTFAEFLASPEYAQLKGIGSGKIIFPKDSQEEYESRLKVLGSLRTSSVSMPMPPVDPENTNQPCDRFAGTMQLSKDGKTRFVFLDRLHFLHFCSEKFMPWWYDVRLRVIPRLPFRRLASGLSKSVRKPLTVVHINDVMETQNVREPSTVEVYAREIVDAVRVADGLHGSIYLIYSKTGHNVRRVAALLRQEFDGIHDCRGIYSCLQDVRSARFDPPLLNSSTEMVALFGPNGTATPPGGLAVRLMEWALGMQADVFVGNIHSPYSRNVCLYRKGHGTPYKILRGFFEMRKIWKWNL